MNTSDAAAFFDLDRTIIGGSSMFTFGWVAYRNGFVPTGQLIKDAASAVTFQLAGASDDKTEAVKQRILEAIEGAAVTSLTDLGDEIIPRLLKAASRTPKMDQDGSI